MEGFHISISLALLKYVCVRLKKRKTENYLMSIAARYGQWNILNFRFELWNEPDLKTYNILNFTLTGKTVIPDE